MRDVHRLEPVSANPGSGTVLAAWERFVQGEDQVPGVRPVVAISWHRCREQYRVDPHLTEAPVAVAEMDHTPEHDVVFAELGFRAASVAHDVGNLGGVVTVTDATGRILAEWGDQATLARATDANLAPWFCWSEYAAGTNGMGTALEAHGPVLIRGAEHWCQAFHNWVCAGIAVRDVVTREPIAVLNISCWRSQLPASAGRVAGERGHQDPAHAEEARPGQRRRAGRGLHPGQGALRCGARRGGHRGQGGDRRRHGERAPGRPGIHPGGRPHAAMEPRAAGIDREPPGMPAGRRPTILTGSARRRSSPTSPTSRRRSASDPSSRPGT